MEKSNYRRNNMLDIKFVRENPEIVKENIKKKFQDEKLPLVDEVIELDRQIREIKTKVEGLKAQKNKASAEIGALMRQGKKDEAAKVKASVGEYANEIDELDAKLPELNKVFLEKMYVIPNIVDPSVPVGRNDQFNVEVQRFGEPKVPSYEIPFHGDIMASFDGLDKDASARTSGYGFYYLIGDMAQLHSAMLAYARDFMIKAGFTYCIPPFMIHGDVVNGVMSFAEMENMMYKIEGEDLYLIGTSEHSMIGRFKDQIIKSQALPLTLTSYSPCFRKEVGAHGIEERGVYRVHQFEKEEMIVICKPEESMDWYNKLWKLTVDYFRSLDVPVRQLECCTGDLADLKVKSCDVEAWSPRQQKYFEVGSCSTLGDAQARRLGIRYKDENGTHLCHTLNNTVVASPRGLIAVIENNYNEDGTINVPAALQPYMGGKTKLVPLKK
jgi:seryl-tRNA synthetase